MIQNPLPSPPKGEGIFLRASPLGEVWRGVMFGTPSLTLPKGEGIISRASPCGGGLEGGSLSSR